MTRLLILCVIFCLQGLYAESETLFEKYGKQYGIPPQILWGIAKVESNFNPYAVNKNKNNTYDIGLMQINTIHLKTLAKEGIEPRDLFHPETSVAVGTYILSKCFEKHGQNWKGLTCYNGKIEGNDYGSKVLSGILSASQEKQNKAIGHVALSN